VAELKLPAPGEKVTVRWPGSEYDFVIEFQHAQVDTPPGWFTIQGVVMFPEGPEHLGIRRFYVRQLAEDVFTLVPKRD
jgi:hypothetical protein